MLTLYEFSIPPLKRLLTNLSVILTKAEAHADEKKIDHSVFLNARLSPDMYPLTRQIQIATDMSKGGVARLAGVDIPKYEDDETSFADLQARIANTLVFIDTITPAQLEHAEIRDVVISMRDRTLAFKGQAYLLNWVNPNVYFHVTTAYNILRHHGVALNKQDYLGALDAND